MNETFYMPAHATDELLPPQSGPIKILLTATKRWPSAARLMIEFSRLGHIVSIIRPVYGHPSRKVRAVHNAFPYRPLAPLESLAAAIEAARPDLIIPCDDLGVRHLHLLHASKRARYASAFDIPALIVRSLGPPESYATVNSRYLLLKLSREDGIRTPETSVINELGELDRRHSIQPFPWVLKADGTTGGNGVRVVQSLDEARRCFTDLRGSPGLMRMLKRLTVDRDLILERQLWDGMRRIRPAVVAQSFIRGNPANCAVVCWKGNILAGVGCEAVSTESPTGPATVVRLVDNAEMMSAAEKIARRLGLSGFFGLDFVIEEGTGAAYLIEMNPRCTPPSHLRLGIGRDMIGALSAQLTGIPLREPASITQSNLIAYFPQALLRNSELLSSCYHDIPERESELIQELLQPWPDRRVVNTMIASLRSRLFSN
jgi:carbamoylphosphate synthase large subunit